MDINFLSLIKKLPVDVGQSEKKHSTAGKRIAISFVSDAENKTALDIGCRDGYWSDKLKEKGYRVKSLDLEPHYKGAIKHDVEQGLPFRKNSIDLVWCTEVLEHLYDPEFLFKEINRIIKPGGMAILTTPNSDWWIYWILGLLGLTPKKLQNKDHKQFFREKSIRKLAFGYKIYGYFPYALFFIRIKRFIGFLSPTFILVKHF